jgi:hypothetical protein
MFAKVFRSNSSPAGLFVWAGVIAIIALCFAPAAYAGSSPTSYQGAPMWLPGVSSTHGVTQDMVVDANGTVYISDAGNNRVIVETQAYLGDALTGDTGTATYLAANPNTVSYITCANLTGGLSGPTGMAITGNGTLYIADTGHSRVVTVNVATPATCSVLLGNTTGIADGGTTYYLTTPVGVAVDEYGDVFISDQTTGPHNFMWGWAYNVSYGSGNNPNGGYPGYGMIIWIPGTTQTIAGNTYTAGAPYEIMDSNTPTAANTNYCPPTLYCGYANGYAGAGDEPYYSGFFINYNEVVVNGVAAPNRIAWDKTDDILFIADTGNSRIMALGYQWIRNGFPQTPTGTTCLIGFCAQQLGAPGAPWEIETTGAWHYPSQLPLPYDNEITWNPTPGNNQSPVGIAVDSQGDLLWTDSSGNYLPNAYILPHPAPGGSWNSTNYALNVNNGGGSANGSNSTPATGYSLNSPWGIYADQWGTVYAADSLNDGVVANLPRTYTGNGPGGAVNFHQVPLNSPNNQYEWQQLAFNIPNGLTVGGVSAYTEGIENLDFNVTNHTTPGYCYSGASYQTCYLWVTFRPTAPGLRRGALAMYDQSGNEIANVPLFGFAAAPEVEFFPTGYGATISTGAASTIQPMQIALDGANNLYVASYTGDSVVLVPQQGGSGEILAVPASGNYSYPEQATGVAVDGAGNVFVSDHQANQIWVSNPAANYQGFSPLVIDGLSTPLSQPMELNFDPAGNLYIADSGNGRVVEVDGIFAVGNGKFEGRGSVVQTTATCYVTSSGNCVAAGGYNLPAATGGSGYHSVTGVAVDPWENVYITDAKNNQLLVAPQSMNQINPGFASAGRLNWPYNTTSLPGVTTGLNLPYGLATDGMGNLYIADSGNNRIIMGNVPAEYSTSFGSPRNTGNGVTVTSNTSSPGALGTNLWSIAVDPSGNVFVPDYLNNRIAAFYPTVVPTLSFASTYVGSTTSVKSFTEWNIGDEYLTYAASAPVLTGSQFTLSYPSGACPQAPTTGVYAGLYVLAPDTGCTLNATFAPTLVGVLPGTVTIGDNTWYANSTQTATLQPLAPGGVQSFAFGVPNPQSAIANPGATATFAVPVSPVGSTTFGSAITFTVSGVPNSSTVVITPSTLAATGSATVVSFTVTPPSLTGKNEMRGRNLIPVSFALLLLPLLGVRRVRKNWQRYVALLILLVGGLAGTLVLNGCSTTPSGYFGQGGVTYDYTITLTGTSAAGATQTTTFLLQVN